MTSPRKGLMDPNFKYVPAASTNLAATFERIRLEMKQAESQSRKPANVKPIKKVA